MAQDCIFCKIVSGEVPSDTVYEDEELFVFKDINPQASVHLLVIPKKHISSLADVTEEDYGLLGRMMGMAHLGLGPLLIRVRWVGKMSFICTFMCWVETLRCRR
jgi:diadenosine tetraphosphate (Ap4A) HIT family hydrolase